MECLVTRTLDGFLVRIPAHCPTPAGINHGQFARVVDADDLEGHLVAARLDGKLMIRRYLPLADGNVLLVGSTELDITAVAPDRLEILGRVVQIETVL